MQIFDVFTLTIIFWLWHHKSKGYFEIIEEFGCHDTEFRLACESLNASIAIFEATFSQNDSLHTSCGNSSLASNEINRHLNRLKNTENLFNAIGNSKGTKQVNFRHSVNRRCSGINYCSFVFSEDFESAAKLGPGAVYLRYACIDDLLVTRGCNSKIDVSVEGFVRTPGYPGYYIGDNTCHWNLKAVSPQRVKISFLDVSLRGLAPFEGDCLDKLIVSAEGLHLLSTCGDILESKVIESSGQTLSVTFKTSSKVLFPKRGFLFHYKAVGCPTLHKPQDGYLVSKNDTFAHYRCSTGFIFPDTLSRDRILKCYNENTWDGQVLDCVDVTPFLENGTYSSDLSKRNITAEARTAMETTTVTDILAPSLLILILLLGNGIILFLIFWFRQKSTNNEEIALQEQGVDSEKTPRSKKKSEATKGGTVTTMAATYEEQKPSKK